MAKLRTSWLTWMGPATAAAALGWGWGMASVAVAQPRAADQDAAEVEALPPAPASTATAAPKVAPVGVAPMPAVPTMYETGRVGFVDLSDSRSDVKIQQVGGAAAMAPQQALQEASVEAAADRLENAVVAPPSGLLDPEALERESALHVASLAGCRLEVARRKQVTLGAVDAGRMTLRWTILPAGTTAQTEVVAGDPADPQLIDCIKRRMSLWEFTRPHGGPVRVSRAYAFR